MSELAKDIDQKSPLPLSSVSETEEDRDSVPSSLFSLSTHGTFRKVPTAALTTTPSETEDGPASAFSFSSTGSDSACPASPSLSVRRLKSQPRLKTVLDDAIFDQFWFAWCSSNGTLSKEQQRVFQAAASIDVDRLASYGPDAYSGFMGLHSRLFWRSLQVCGLLPIGRIPYLKHFMSVLNVFALLWALFVRVNSNSYRYPVLEATMFACSYVSYCAIFGFAYLVVHYRLPQHIMRHLILQGHEVTRAKNSKWRKYVGRSARNHALCYIALAVPSFLLTNSEAIGHLITGTPFPLASSSIDDAIYARLGRIYTVWLLYCGAVVSQVSYLGAMMSVLVFWGLSKRLSLLSDQTARPTYNRKSVLLWFEHVLRHENISHAWFIPGYTVVAVLAIVFLTLCSYMMVDSQGQYPKTKHFLFPTASTFIMTIIFAFGYHTTQHMLRVGTRLRRRKADRNKPASFAHTSVESIQLSRIWNSPMMSSKAILPMESDVQSTQYVRRMLPVAERVDDIKDDRVVELPSLREIRHVYYKLLQRMGLITIVALAVLMVRSVVRFPSCVDQRDTINGGLRFNSGQRCSPNHRVLIAIDSSYIGYASWVMAPYCLAVAMFGAETMKSATKPVSIGWFVYGTLLLIFSLATDPDVVLEVGYTISSTMCFVSTWYCARVSSANGHNRYYSHLLVSAAVLTAAVISVQSYFIIPAYAEVSSDNERIVLAVIAHPILRVGFQIMLAMYVSWLRTKPGMDLPNLFMLYALPTIFVSIIARLFILGIEDVRTQLSLSFLYAMWEVIFRLTAPLRTYLLQKLRCQSHARALTVTQKDIKARIYVQHMFLGSFVEMHAITFASAAFVLVKWRYGQTEDLSPMLAVAIASQFFAETVADILSCFLESNYLERNMWAYWNLYLSRFQYSTLVIGLVIVADCFSAGEYIAIIESTTRAL